MTSSSLYWLSDAEWSKIEPLMPRGRRGAHRVDDRRVISGIMHCFVRAHGGATVRPPMAHIRRSITASTDGAGKGAGSRIFEALTGSTSITGTVAIDSSTIKAHRS